MGYDMYWRERPGWAVEEGEKANKAFYAAIEVRDQLITSAGLDKYRTNDTPEQAELRKKIMDSPEYKAADEAVVWPKEPYYFRLNIWGMGAMRDIMESLQIGYWAPIPDFPDAKEHGIDWEDEGVYESEAYEKYQRDVLEPYLSAHPIPPDQDLAMAALPGGEDQPSGPVTRLPVKELLGIPLHKFTSNDGWIVTPEECKEAWRIYQSIPETRIQKIMAARVENGETPEELAKWLDEWMLWVRAAADYGGFEVN